MDAEEIAEMAWREKKLAEMIANAERHPINLAEVDDAKDDYWNRLDKEN